MTAALLQITPYPYTAFHHPQWDDNDTRMVEERMFKRAAYTHGPQVGDWVRLHTGDHLQLSFTGKFKARFAAPEGVYTLESTGELRYQGNDITYPVPIDILRQTSERRPAWANIFHRNKWWDDDAALAFQVDLPVWEAPFLRRVENYL